MATGIISAANRSKCGFEHGSEWQLAPLESHPERRILVNQRQLMCSMMLVDSSSVHDIESKHRYTPSSNFKKTLKANGI